MTNATHIGDDKEKRELLDNNKNYILPFSPISVWQSATASSMAHAKGHIRCWKHFKTSKAGENGRCE